MPNEIEDALEQLEQSKEIKEAFGEDTINSYIKLKRSEIENFDKEETFDKKSPVTDWEKKIPWIVNKWKQSLKKETGKFHHL